MWKCRGAGYRVCECGSVGVQSEGECGSVGVQGAG